MPPSFTLLYAFKYIMPTFKCKQKIVAAKMAIIAIIVGGSTGVNPRLMIVPLRPHRLDGGCDGVDARPIVI
ncbi:MAG: hypothetical protein KatS3mg016_2139 [Fimbriimonadales bacterium]|nr:MAG: hypothetical protein KatS3mg016_2139 [Fimbriimonadales bacterium]